METGEAVKSGLARWAGALWRRPWIGFVTVFAYAIWQRWQMPWLPLGTDDSWGFLAPVLHELRGEGFRQTHGRGFAYPVFLLSIVRAAESFHAIALVQHVLGLLSGMVWIWAFALWTAWLPQAIRRRHYVWWLGAFALALYLWGAWTVVHETMLRPEAIFSFFALLQIALTFDFFRARWHSSGSLRAVVSGALAMLCAVFCLGLKPSWGFAAAMPAFALLVGIIWPGPSAKRLAAALALVCGLLLAGLWQKGVPQITGWVPDEGSKLFLPATLFTVHADLIAATMREQEERGELDAEEKIFLEQLDQRLVEARRAPLKYRVLGHDPDYLMYRSDALAKLPGEADTSAATRADYFRSAYFSAMRGQPMGMMAKVSRQVLRAHRDATLSLHCSSLPWRVHLETARGFQAANRALALPPPLSAGWEQLFLDCQAAASVEPERRAFVFRLPDWFVRGFLSVVVGLLTIVGLCVFPAGRWLFGPASVSDLLPAARVFAVLVLSQLGTILTVAIVHSFDVRRYLALLSPTQSLLLATGSVLLVAFFSAMWSARRVSSVGISSR